MYYILIQNNKTKQSKLHIDDYEWPTEQDMLFQWTENNYSCDCNRGIFFGENEDINCGDGVYSIFIYDSNGEFVAGD